MNSMERALDEGGFARLDVSDLAPAHLGDLTGVSSSEDDPHGGALEQGVCDWCASPWRGGGAYLVVADNRHHKVCPTCWGRSPGYMELRHKGLGHNEALARLGVGTGMQTE
jgi:hypothetical protein